MDDDDGLNQDICRVCRSEASQDRPLFHPCICTGSIKFIHQDCLVQWLRYSRKEYCELCKHRFSFTPIYSPDMPPRLPIADILSGLARSMGTAIKYWLHYTLVAVAWLGIVPLTACRIYRCLFTGSIASLFTLPIDLLSTENLMSDIFHGCLVVTCTLSAFISLVWLREQILHGGGPDWLDNREQGEAAAGGGVADVDEPAQHNHNNAAAANGHDLGLMQQLGLGNANANPAAVPVNAPGLAAAAADNDNLVADADNGNGGDGGEDINWNPIEWDRAAEELTWERLLGLDGSLVFLEHVFWVVSLNTMFILVFAFCPYHIGHFSLAGVGVKGWLTSSHFEGLLTALCGYCVLGVALVLLHAIVAFTAFAKLRRALGLGYVVVKVALLSVVEIGVFPLIGGWWLDICSLSLFDATLKDREASFRAAPGTSMFFHWLVGMVYVFYFASFILLLREVLRPGVLWFLRNLNDPDFNPVQEMIHLPIFRHSRRFLASTVIFGSTVLLMLWLPIRLVQVVWPAFLPYYFALSSDAVGSELSLELLLLQVILPALLEQSQTRAWLKLLVRHWCVVVSRLLGLRSYLLGDVPLQQQEGKLIRGEMPPDEQQPNQADAPVANNNPADAAADAAADDDDDGAGARHQLLDAIRQQLGIELEENDGNNNINNNNNNNEVGVENMQQQLPPQPLHNDDAVDGDDAVVDDSVREDAVNEEVAGENHDDADHEADNQVEDEFNNAGDAAALGGGLGAAHQALLQREGPIGFRAYVQPPWFGLRVLCLVVLMCLSLTLAAMLCLTLPVFLGRQVMALVMGKGNKVHELYTGSCGLYLCLLSVRAVTLVVAWCRLGWTQVLHKLQGWAVLGVKAVVGVAVVAVVIPLLVGVLVELVLVLPLRVPLHQTPILFLWQDWALGVLNTKIICALVMMGPNWWLKSHLERIYLGGLRNVDLKLVVCGTALPVIAGLLTALALPHVLAETVAPFLVDEPSLVLVQRRIYPAALFLAVTSLLVRLQLAQFARLYEHIKNDKYLVGRRLVNYNHQRNNNANAAAAAAAAASAAKTAGEGAAGGDAVVVDGNNTEGSRNDDLGGSNANDRGDVIGTSGDNRGAAVVVGNEVEI